MSITNYEIKVPSVIKPGEAFVVRVIARDVNGNVVPDNATVVTLSSSSPDIEWDGNANEVFGEMGDDAKSLIQGVADFIAKDSKAPTFTISASDVQARTGQGAGEYRFNVIVFDTGVAYNTEVQNYEFIRFIGRGDGARDVTLPANSEPIYQDSFFVLSKAL